MPTAPVTWLDQQTANITTTNTQFEPKVIQLANGNLLVVWTSNDDSGVGSPAGFDIIGQIFNPAGEKIGVEFRLNTFGSVDQEQSPDIAALPDGGFVMAYWDADNTGTGGNILVQTYNATGTPVNSQFIVSDSGNNTDPYYRNPHVAVSSGTSVMVTYEVTNGVGDVDVVGKIYNPTTNTVGSEINLIAYPGINSSSDVTALTNGNYVVVAQNDNAGDGRITYRIVNSAGANVLGVTDVAGTASNALFDGDPSIAALTGGGFAIAFQRVSGGDSDVYVFGYNAAGTQTGTGYVGPEASSAVTSHNEAEVIALADGTFIVAYDDDSGTAGLQVDRFNAAGFWQGSNINAQLENGTTIAGTGLADGRFVTVWSNGVGEIGLEIFDTRDVPNATAVNTTNLRVGTINGETINAAAGETVYAGDGNDIVISASTVGGAFLGNGDDEFRAGIGASETADGGAGTDLLNTSSWNGGYNINLTTGVTNFGDSFTNFENVITGNGDTTIVGTTGSNVITTGTGNDTIYGSTVGDFNAAGFDTINSGDGNDSVFSSGNGLFNLGSGNDTFFAGLTGTTETADGGIGVDSIDTTSFNGNYTVNLAAGTTNFGETYTNFENLTTGNGNDVLSGTTGDNILNGTGGNDILAGLGGNDTLIGGAGSNQYIGGTGNDIYIVQAANPTEAVLQTLFEAAGEGTDEVRVTTSVFALEWYGSSELENLTLTDNAAHTAIGNAFNNIITGGTGADDLFGRNGDDRLIGGSGAANTMIGGAGNDTYVVTAVGDTVIEFAGEGIDLVEAGVSSFTLRDNVDNLTFTGANTDRIGVGNAGFNVIRGLGGADSLNGLGGADDIIGGSGNDILQGGTDGSQDWFVYLGGETGLDRILDFQSGVDKIAFSLAGFSPTATRDFVSGVGAVATSANSTILYDPSTGIVSYDDDGNGAGAAIQIAQLNAGQPFVATDFLFTGSY